MLKFCRLALVLAVLVSALPISAEDPTKEVEIRGFGTWTYGDTDGNDYLLGTEEGSYDHMEFALSVSARPYERLTINAQVFFIREEDEQEVELDFAFAEWEFSDALKFRIGQPKHPFGIYAEIFDVGTARPFLFLPQGIYGPAANVAESYLGVGLTGSRYTKSGWGIAYDVYAGELPLPFENTFGVLFGDEEKEGEEGGEEKEAEEIDDALGGRLTVLTPVDGLNFGFSAFTGQEEAEEGEEESESGADFIVVGLHLEYLSNTWSLRAEYTNLEDDVFGLEVDSAYFESAYRFTTRWQLAARYDWSDGELEEVDTSLAPSLLEHEDWALAVNYWFNPSFVLKLEYHMVDGNRFANPGDRLAESIAEGELETETDLILFGASFSF